MSLVAARSVAARRGSFACAGHHALRPLTCDAQGIGALNLPSGPPPPQIRSLEGGSPPKRPPSLNC